MAKEKKEKISGSHTVITEFRDAKDFNKIHSVGDDVSHLDESRLKKLVELGYVKEEKEEE